MTLNFQLNFEKEFLVLDKNKPTRIFNKVDWMTFRDSIKHEVNVLSFSIQTLRVLLFVSLAGNSFSNSINVHAGVILLEYSLKCAQE